MRTPNRFFAIARMTDEAYISGPAPDEIAKFRIQ